MSCFTWRVPGKCYGCNMFSFFSTAAWMKKHRCYVKTRFLVSMVSSIWRYSSFWSIFFKWVNWWQHRLNLSEIIHLEYQPPVWLLRAKLRLKTRYPIVSRFQKTSAGSRGILPIGSWTWSVAKWLAMPQSRASNPQLWHRNGGMVWPTVGLWMTNVLEDVSEPTSSP